ncbi:hypothetical protein ACHWQZ_G001596 [Mnemiopsis leidyi]
MDKQLLLNFPTRPLASLLIHHPIQSTKVPHSQSDLETHRRLIKKRTAQTSPLKVFKLKLKPIYLQAYENLTILKLR